MEWIQLSGLSIGSLTTTILLALIVVYLLALREKRADTWYLIGYMASLFVLITAYTLRYSVYHPADAWFSQMANLVVFGGVSLIQFAYRYQERLGRREPVIVLALSLFAATGSWFMDFFSAGLPSVPDIPGLGYRATYGMSVSLVALISHLWAVVVLLRKSRRFSRSAVESSRYPYERWMRSSRNFALLVAATALVATTHLFFRVGVLSRTQYVTVFNVGSLLVGLFIFVVYINNSPRPVSFLLKLVGVSLAAVLVSLGLAATALSPVVEETIADYFAVKAEQAAALASATESGPIQDEDIGYVVDADGRVAFAAGDTPSWALTSAVSRARRLPRGTEIWGSRLSFLQQYDANEPFLTRVVSAGGATYLVGIRYEAYRLVAHRFWARLALVVVATAAIIVAIYPVFFTRSLLLPIRRLISAVDQVSSGNLGVRVPVESGDETGQLSRAYNSMIESLGQARVLMREQQRQIMQADKLASIGELVAGVAHEIHNPNQVISLRAHVLEGGLPDLFAAVDDLGGVDPDVRLGGMSYGEFRETASRAVEEIKSSAGRINKIVGDLKGYVRSDAVSPALTASVNDAVSAVVDMSIHVVRSATDEFELTLAEEPFQARIGKTELEQVILNLLQNACHALSRRDQRITVSTRPREGGRAEIVVADEGVGMSEETLARVFDPFFTTKRESGGTGLGLSVSRRLVKQVGGELRIESTPGAGTRAVVELERA